MLTKRIKTIVNLYLLSGILFGILGCISITMATPQKQRYPQEAKRAVNVTIDTTQRQQFFDQLRKFSDKHNFKILIDTRSLGAEYFLVSISGGDIEIDGANAFVPEEYSFGFYYADLLHPVSESALDDLVNDFQVFISEVPSATFSVEK